MKGYYTGKISCMVFLMMAMGFRYYALAAENAFISGEDSRHEAVIETDSFNGTEGIVTINQSPGNVNNQGNLIILLTPGNGPDASDSVMESAVDISGSSKRVEAEDSVRSDLIRDDAFSYMTGILAVNQISGNATDQIIAITISLGEGAIPDLSESDLMSVTSHNNNRERLEDVTAEDVIESPAFTGARGVLAVSQSAGDINQSTSLIDISFQQITLP